MFDHVSQAEFAVDDAGYVARHTAEHLAGHGGTLTEDADGWVLDFGLRRARLSVSGNRLRLLAEGRDASLEQEMRLELAGHVAEFGGPARIDWPGAAPITAPPGFRLLTVADVTDITPHMRRIRLTGRDLLRFDTLRSMHCKLLLTPAGQDPVWPTLDDNGRFLHGNSLVRKYTIRAIGVADGWMDIDFVIHDAVSGPGSDWAAAAQTGDMLGLTGPGGGGVPMADRLLLAGDETALPAIARAIEALPRSSTAHAVIEVADPDEKQPLAAHPGLTVDWLYRGKAAPGALLAAAVADLAPDHDTSVWAACEFAGFRAIRTDLRGRLNHPRSQHLVTSYWRAGMAADLMEMRKSE